MGFRVHQVGGGRVTLVERSATGAWATETRARLETRIAATLHDGRRYLRPLLRALEAGEVVLTACDATGGGEELGRRLVRPVLGQPMALPVGPVWLAWRSGAPLLTVACRRNRGGPAPFAAEIGPEVPVARGEPVGEALERGADEVAAFLSRALMAWPDEWHFWDGFEPGGLIV
jgi:lauroyl/myristoyl acyltransferase